ncbi:hypothetical protein M422DRAFT_254136 [Sphaerobolus stellatus SS14]|uniref:Unplaced genomic scaffold SPHSTscaffold_53, whole genome shotgun sequence n=1 Tax=Sphaerobolus stellatus (strain SS14) TaxID=990650 RepID=A0A0C9VVK4_SPHS4|nr:hypothetical protein M422DRAFT_254136 [Sphaerobolus stellatus SS14]
MAPASCRVCKLFQPFRHHQAFDDPIHYYRNYRRRALAEFIDSRKAGCRGCGMVLDAIESYEPGWVGSHAADGGVKMTIYTSMFWVKLYDGSRKHTVGEFTLFQSQDDPAAPLLTKPFYSSRGIVRNSASDLALERAFAWLANCVENHRCVAPQSNYMPRRLLDIRLSMDMEPSSSSSHKDELRLVEELSELAPYATLSYCWGSDLTGIMRTLRENKDVHRRGIAVNSLPKTVQDAVLVCRGLGLHYLWVDALCIIQDDKEDWQREALQMRSVYSNSHVTIAAHAAVSCKDGFLGEQDFGRLSWQREFWTDCGPKPRNKMYVRVGKPPEWPGESNPSPLMTRGWTLQEGILPHRLLHYMGTEMAWECDVRHFCECGHVDGLGPEERVQMVKTLVRRGKYTMTERQNLALDGWMDLVERYSKRNLTYESDKLIAIAGLAEYVGDIVSNPNSDAGTHIKGNFLPIDSIYIAGLFRAHLPRQLLWVTMYDVNDIRSSVVSSTDRRPSPCCAPTWSWASTDTHIEYPGCLQYSEVSLVTIHSSGTFSLPCAEGQSFEAVETQDLVIEGLVTPVMLITAERPYKKEYEFTLEEVTDMLRGRASIVRPRGGRTYEVACDKLRDIELKLGDAAYNCWVNGSEIVSSGSDISSNDSGAEYSEDRVNSDTSEGKDSASSPGGSSGEDSGDGSNDNSDRTSDGSSDGISDGDRDYGSEGKSLSSNISRRSISDANLESASASDTSSIPKSNYNHSESDSLHSSSSRTRWCKKCEVKPDQWAEQRFCCLQVAKYHNSGLPTSLFFLVLERSNRVPDSWERIAIGMTEVDEELDSPGLALFEGGEMKRIRIV